MTVIIIIIDNIKTMISIDERLVFEITEAEDRL